MTEKEKKMICDLKNTEELDAIEIGELMQMASTCEGSNKLGNVLFDAITKSFALGYIRGSKKEAKQLLMKKGDAVYFVETNNSIRRATVFSADADVVTLKQGAVDPRYVNSGKHHLESAGGIRLRKSKLFSPNEEAEKCINNKKAAEQRIRENKEIERILKEFK